MATEGQRFGVVLLRGNYSLIPSEKVYLLQYPLAFSVKCKAIPCSVAGGYTWELIPRCFLLHFTLANWWTKTAFSFNLELTLGVCKIHKYSFALWNAFLCVCWFFFIYWSILLPSSMLSNYVHSELPYYSLDFAPIYIFNFGFIFLAIHLFCFFKNQTPCFIVFFLCFSV